MQCSYHKQHRLSKDGLRAIFILNTTPIICIIILLWGEHLMRHRAKNTKVILTKYKAGTRSIWICTAYTEEVNKHITEWGTTAKQWAQGCWGDQDNLFWRLSQTQTLMYFCPVPKQGSYVSRNQALLWQRSFTSLGLPASTRWNFQLKTMGGDNRDIYSRWPSVTSCDSAHVIYEVSFSDSNSPFTWRYDQKFSRYKLLFWVLG